MKLPFSILILTIHVLVRRTNVKALRSMWALFSPSQNMLDDLNVIRQELLPDEKEKSDLQAHTHTEVQSVFTR